MINFIAGIISGITGFIIFVLWVPVDTSCVGTGGERKMPELNNETGKFVVIFSDGTVETFNSMDAARSEVAEDDDIESVKMFRFTQEYSVKSQGILFSKV